MLCACTYLCHFHYVVASSEEIALRLIKFENAARPADESPLDWATRMKIATGAAQGLQYLHDEANPPVIYRDFKSSNILLDEEFNPRLCDYGLAKVAESGSTSSLPPRVMGTYGYSAPEYASSGELTLKSDVYSFGVVLLELISGRRAIDPDRPPNEQNLITLVRTHTQIISLKLHITCVELKYIIILMSTKLPSMYPKNSSKRQLM